MAGEPQHKLTGWEKRAYAWSENGTPWDIRKAQDL